MSVRLHSYIMIHVKGDGFLLSAYLNQFDCSLELESGQRVQLDDYVYTYNSLHKLDHMIHELWAAGTTQLERMKDSAGILRIEYRLFSYPGQGSPDVIEQVVPVLARGAHAQRYSSNPSHWKTR
ncbi:hypothetical protein S4A8_12382 [Salinisphaera sp. S4-8]